MLNTYPMDQINSYRKLGQEYFGLDVKISMATCEQHIPVRAMHAFAILNNLLGVIAEPVTLV